MFSQDSYSFEMLPGTDGSVVDQPVGTVAATDTESDAVHYSLDGVRVVRTPGSVYMVGDDNDALYKVDSATGKVERVGTATGFGAGITVVRLDPGQFVPAPAQGALALQCRRDRADVRAALAPLDHPATRRAVDAERRLLGRLEGGCELAFGAHCAPREDDCVIDTMLEREGRIYMESGRGAEPLAVAEGLWQRLCAPPPGTPAAP